MSSEPLSYDLTRERWLPAQRLDGSEVLLSLTEIFGQAHRLRRLVGDIPTQEFALLRLLLAVLHDAIEGPVDLDHWTELWESGLPVDAVTRYLATYRERFDLLHPKTPFLQTAGLQTAGDEVSSLDKIVADVPNGERFFTMRARGAQRLDFAEAARWVVHAHAFDTSGIKSGAVDDPRTRNGKVYPLGVGWSGNLGGVLVEESSLDRTLLLNLIAFDCDNLQVDLGRDLPAWRRDPPGPAEGELTGRPAGPRDLYTWQSRRIRLCHDAAGVHGVVLCYGDSLSARNLHQKEPMTAWRRSPAQEKKLGLPQVYLPLEHDPARSGWRGLGALVAGRSPGGGQRAEAAAVVRPRILDWIARLSVEADFPPDYLARTKLYGAVYGTQQSVIDDIVCDEVSIPVVLLHQRDSRLGQAAINAVSDAEAAVGILGDLAADLAEMTGADRDSRKDAARALGFSQLDTVFPAWLESLRPKDSPVARRAQWQDTARRIIARLGDELVHAAGDPAWTGRVITTRAGQQYWLNTSSASLTFRARLRKALPGTDAEQEQ